jgi:hypothetical protein
MYFLCLMSIVNKHLRRTHENNKFSTKRSKEDCFGANYPILRIQLNKQYVPNV